MASQLRETMTFVLVLLAGLAAACSGSQSPGDPAPLPAPQTSATLVGPLCEMGRCQCREDGGDPSHEVPAGVKRYELRLGPSDNALWATVGDMVLYKSNERALECFYVDLPPGRHAVRLRASRQTGFGAQLRIRELAPQNQGWYETFDFQCGVPGICSRESLSEWKSRIEAVADNTHDRCGSTKIRQVQWLTGRMPDNVPPGDLQLDFVLDVYKFAPTFAPGAPECSGAQ